MVLDLPCAGRLCRQDIITTLYSATGAESPQLARKPNYGFEKRKKEMDRKAKKDAKREDRRRRREEGTEDVGTPGVPGEGEEQNDSGAGGPTA